MLYYLLSPSFFASLRCKYNGFSSLVADEHQPDNTSPAQSIHCLGIGELISGQPAMAVTQRRYTEVEIRLKSK